MLNTRPSIFIYGLQMITRINGKLSENNKKEKTYNFHFMLQLYRSELYLV